MLNLYPGETTNGCFLAGESGNLHNVEGSNALGQPSAEHERRAPVLARARLAVQGLGFRDQMEHFAGALAALAPADRRPVYELVRWIVAQWIGRHGPSHRTLVVEVAAGGSGLRALVYCDPDLDDEEFWPELVVGAPRYLIRKWALDRRDSSGIWFELARPAPAPKP